MDEQEKESPQQQMAVTKAPINDQDQLIFFEQFERTSIDWKIDMAAAVSGKGEGEIS